jgi:hypothetical protein
MSVPTYFLKIFVATLIFLSANGLSREGSAQHSSEDTKTISQQRRALAASTNGQGFGPQSPRDLGQFDGSNQRFFGVAPSFQRMNLCNIHFHESAEHKGGEFIRYAGDGDRRGYGTGFKYSGTLTEAELAPIAISVGKTEHGDLVPGDTIEIHFVFSSAHVRPGATLGSCLNKGINNPNLRVESVVAVLVNDPSAVSFAKLTEISNVNGLYQASNIPSNLGDPITYAGSTTGPGFNEKGSPFHVTWSVRPKVLKVDILSLDNWLRDNIFGENHAHGVRNLIINPELLSPIR